MLLVVIDCSGSTLRGRGLSAAKGVLASLLSMAYLKRTRIGLLQVSGGDATPLMLPSRAPKRIDALLTRIGGGGGTPLHKGLHQANTWLQQQRRRLPEQEQTLVVLTDGRVREVPGGLSVVCRSLIVDIECGPVRLGRSRALARTLGSEYLHVDELPLALVRTGT